MGAVRSVASLVRHAGGAATEAILIAALIGLIALLLSPVYGPARFMTGSDDASAAKAAIWIDESTSRNAGGDLTFGQQVSFGYRSDTAQSIQLWCFQPVDSDNLVFADSRMLYEGGWGYGVPFELGPSGAWTGGDATCKAMLGHRLNSGKYRVEASLTFPVSGS